MNEFLRYDNLSIPYVAWYIMCAKYITLIPTLTWEVFNGILNNYLRVVWKVLRDQISRNRNLLVVAVVRLERKHGDQIVSVFLKFK